MARTTQPKGTPYTRLPPKSSTLSQTPIVPADFSNLFVLDSTPSAVPTESLYTVQDGSTVSLAAQEQEDEEMRIFAIEVAPSDDDLLEDEDEEEDIQEVNVVAMAVYDNPQELEQAIKGKITDDSAAKVTGRYYKEIDLTRSCGLCGEQGHTSRECTHSQCFTCGEVDGDHEARNCPVTLVCSSCASRGHFSRDCPLAQGTRSSYGARCALCQSGLHATSNCSSHWRVYDITDAKPTKRKVTYACGNDGSTDDHFIDDCLLPRMHPIRFVDSSAFNRAAIGSSSGASHTPSSRRQTSGAAGEAVSARRRGAPTQQQQREQEAADDDDWFASRDKANGASGGNARYKKKSRTGPVKEREIVKSDYAGRGRFSKMNAERKTTREGAYALAASGGSSRGTGGSNPSADRRQRSPPPHQSSGGAGGHQSGGGGSNQQKVHIQFSSASRDRYRDSPSANRSSNGRGDKQYDDRRGSGALDYGGGGPSGGARGGSDLASRISEPTRSGGGGRSSGSSRGGGGGGSGRGRSAPAYNGSYF